MPDRPISDADALKAALETDPALRDLGPSMHAIELSVGKVWKEDHQPWFTDHGPQHSRRTANYALSLADLPTISPAQWLSPLEAFVLWAAAWLHDVGMQDLLAAAAPVGQIDEAGFSRVRRQHPQRSSERILDDWTRLGLPEEDAALAQAVASVARAHGTGFYTDTVATRLAGNTRVRNRPVRARLLAALLLFADELDLHYERASGPAGWPSDNSVSEAHKFKHRSVQSVAPICGPNGRIAVELGLAFPKDLAKGDRLAIQRWIEVKLRRQMSLIEREIDEGFAGQVVLDRIVRTTTSELLANAPLPSHAALAIVGKDTARDELINHSEEFDQVRRALAGGGIVVVSDGSGDADEPQGADDLLDAACADAAGSGRTVCVSRRPRLSLGATAADVVGEWAAALGESEPPADRDEHSRRDSALKAVLVAVSRGEGPYLFAVSRAQVIDEHSLLWLQTTAVPALRGGCASAFLLTADASMSFPVAREAVVRVALGETKQEAAAEYLGRFVSRATAAAESQLKRYADIKRLSQYHELELRDGT